MNTVGIMLASGGILWYNIVKEVAGATGAGGLGAPVNIWSPASWLTWVGTVVWKFEHPRGSGGGGGAAGRVRSAGSSGGSGSDDVLHGRGSKRKGSGMAVGTDGRLGWAVRSAGTIGIAGSAATRIAYTPSPSAASTGMRSSTPARTSPPHLSAGGFPGDGGHHTVLEMASRGASDGSGNDTPGLAVRSPRARPSAGTPGLPPRAPATPAWLMGPVATQLLSPGVAGWGSRGSESGNGGGGAGALAYRSPGR